jgi:hypothetical protein
MANLKLEQITKSFDNRLWQVNLVKGNCRVGATKLWLG